MELWAGGIGLLTYVLTSITYPTFFPTWHNLLAVAFFGANIIAGTLLLQQRDEGVTLSFVVQLLQVVFWSSGIAWVARAGLHFTPIIASTGFGVFTGPATEFFSYPVDTTSFGPGFGLSFLLKLDLFWKPLSEATFACGVNLVALYFTMGLWRQLSARPTPTPANVDPTRPDHRTARWGLRVAVGAVALVGLFMMVGGPKSVSRPVARWPVSTGDTLDILWSGVWYEASVRLTDKSASAGRFFLVRYRGDFRDLARDSANSAAVAQWVCQTADSKGTTRILVKPSKSNFGGLVTTSLNYWFAVDTATHCSDAIR